MYRLPVKRAWLACTATSGRLAEAARRGGRGTPLARACRIEYSEHIVDASLVEIQARLAGSPEPASAEPA
jgi:hypothetical protein